MTNTQFEHLRALVAERHGAVLAAFDKLLDAIASNDREKTLAANKVLLQALNNLGSVVAQQHWPNWYKALLNNAQNYSVNHSNGLATWRAHLMALIKNQDALQSHEWFSDVSDRPVLDVDKIIEEAKAEFGVNELFDKIILILVNLADCEDLDSVRACEDLHRVVAILRKARSGSLSSQIVSWQFARRFVPNLITAYLKNSAVARPIVEAFEQTADELNISLDNAKDRIGEQIINVAASSFHSKAIEHIAPSEIRALPDFTAKA